LIGPPVFPEAVFIDHTAGARPQVEQSVKLHFIQLVGEGIAARQVGVDRRFLVRDVRDDDLVRQPGACQEIIRHAGGDEDSRSDEDTCPLLHSPNPD
jgi:peptide deformylase